MTRGLSMIAGGLATVVLAVTVYASPAARACVAAACRPAGQECADAFRRMKRDQLADCAEAAPGRACRRAARQAVASGLRSCRVARRACATCCRTDGAACPVAVCGNALVEPGEACDGAAVRSCAGGCRSDCTCVSPPPVCGNGTREATEQCDGDDDGACPGRCDTRIPTAGGSPGCFCMTPRCGDDIVDDGETCDGFSADACEVACGDNCECVPAVCGNGILAATEACEVGHDEACPGRCTGDCTCAPPPVCGDGVTDPLEQCEPGVTDFYCDTGCLPDCTCAICGNGVIEAPGETCEPAADAVCPGLCSSWSCQCLSPTSDACEAPHVIEAFPVLDRQSTSGAFVAPSDPALSCLLPRTYDRSIWYAFTAPATGRVRLDTSGSTYDTVLALHTGTCGALSEVACVDDPLDVGTDKARVDVPVEAGVAYLVEAAAFPEDPSGELVLSGDFRPCGDGIVNAGEACDPGLAGSCGGQTCSPKCECLDEPADECVDAMVATALPITAHVAAYAATGSDADPLTACGTHPIVQTSVWYRFRAPTDGTVVITTAGSDYDTVLGVFSGACGGLDEITCDDDGAGQYQSRAFIEVSAGTDYTVMVTPYGKDPAARLDLGISYDPGS
jgi:hypothetical protein